MTKTERMHRRQLEKAALIANANLDALMPSEWVKLQADLYEFLSASGLGMFDIPVKNIRPEDIKAHDILVPRHYVSELLKTLREKLTDIATLAAAGVNADLSQAALIQPTSSPYAGFDLEATARVTLRVRSRARSEPFRFKLGMEPKAEAAEWALLYHLAHSRLSPDRVRFCPNCLNVFVLGSHARTDRMRYCSLKCSQTVATKTFRASKKAYELAKRGKSFVAIAKELKTDVETVQKWVRDGRRKAQAAKLTSKKGRNQ